MEPSFLRVCAQHEYVISFQNLRRDAFLGGNMANVVIMPKVGITVTDCILTTWYKKVGDTVQKGEPLFSYETDKASIDEESEFSGTILDQFYEEGDVVECLADVCVIGEPGEKYERPAGAAPAAAEAPAAEEAPAAAAPAAAPAAAAPKAEANGAPISPRAKTFAKQLGVQTEGIAPSGPEGRVIARDVIAAAEAGTAKKVETAAAPAAAVAPAAAGGGYTDKKQSNVRKVIARAMSTSLSTIPQLTLNTSFDATAVLALRKKFKECAFTDEFAGITLNDMMIHAVSKVLPDFPELNAHLLDDTLRVFDDVNVGCAVDTDRGLLVPAVVAADKMSLLEISKKLKEVIGAAKQGNINPDLLNCGTFTVTNLGSLGIESFTPVINPPQTGILGVDNVVYRMKKSGETYPAMGLSLTFDHRAIDGAPAARFLKALVNYLENFDMMQMK